MKEKNLTGISKYIVKINYLKGSMKKDKCSKYWYIDIKQLSATNKLKDAKYDFKAESMGQGNKNIMLSECI